MGNRTINKPFDPVDNRSCRKPIWLKIDYRMSQPTPYFHILIMTYWVIRTVENEQLSSNLRDWSIRHRLNVKVSRKLFRFIENQFCRKRNKSKSESKPEQIRNGSYQKRNVFAGFNFRQVPFLRNSCYPDRQPCRVLADTAVTRSNTGLGRLLNEKM